MKRLSLAKLLGGFALLAPVTAPAWAENPNYRSLISIYSGDQIVARSIAQQPMPLEQSVPATTENQPSSTPPQMEEAGAAAQVENGLEQEEVEDRGLLQQHLDAGPLGCWLACNRIKVYGWIDQGYTWNPDSPDDRQNFGRLFTDRSNDYRLNQIVTTFERELDPEPCQSDWGFKFQFLYGSDARFIHSLGFMDNITDASVQPDIVEMYMSYHAPILTSGGVDFKVGQFVTLHGYELITAPQNPLYSHSYSFNFGIPFKHTGILTTTHVSDALDIHAGVVAGINTGTFFDNNDDVSFHGGFTYKPCGDILVINGAMTFGPENDTNWEGVGGTEVSDDNRYIFNLTPVYQLNECVTLASDINYGVEEGFGGAEWYGLAQYYIYKVNPCLSLILRTEVFRDDDGFAVYKDASNDGFIDLQHGDFTPDGSTNIPGMTFGGADTYYAVTAGVNIQPYENLVFRPEVRWDWADETRPYDDSSDGSQFTVGMDVIWLF